MAGREGRDGVAQRIEPGDVIGGERLVVKLLGQDDVDHRREDRRVLARHGLDMHAGPLRGLGAARIDDDQLHAPLQRLDQPAAGILRGHGDADRDQRIAADDQPGVGVVEAVRPRFPCARQRIGDILAWLVDRHRREDHRRADRRRPGHRDRRHQRITGIVGAEIHGDAARAMLGDDRVDPRGHLVDRPFGGNAVMGSVRVPAHRMEQAVRMMELFRQRLAARAAEAVEGRALPIAGRLHHPSVLDRDGDRTADIAEAADRGMFAYRHRLFPSHGLAAPYFNRQAGSG
jgi:hypothetical protein